MQRAPLEESWGQRFPSFWISGQLFGICHIIQLCQARDLQVLQRDLSTERHVRKITRDVRPLQIQTRILQASRTKQRGWNNGRSLQDQDRTFSLPSIHLPLIARPATDMCNHCRCDNVLVHLSPSRQLNNRALEIHIRKFNAIKPHYPRLHGTF